MQWTFENGKSNATTAPMPDGADMAEKRTPTLWQMYTAKGERITLAFLCGFILLVLLYSGMVMVEGVGQSVSYCKDRIR